MTFKENNMSKNPIKEEEINSYLYDTLMQSLNTKKYFLEENRALLIKAAQLIADAIHKGQKVLIFGNGGSAADAQHMAAEMVGRMLVDRRPLPAIALTTDSSNLTAIGNDFGYDHVFSRQIEALGRPGDVVIAISTSGGSKNVLEGMREAKSGGLRVIGLTGIIQQKFIQNCDICLYASAGSNSSRIQETHIFAIHSLVDLVDRYFLNK